ncbi:MAG: TetR/AcrR family transcriptional regulator [Planctomycetes bacterium]|nr:TetR/AcrR family transcriptional regulator [Planctomycetota bacterium]
MKKPTRQRLVEAARELFLAKGYEAASVADVLARAEVNSGSLYYFFKTKEQLLLAVLDEYVDLLEPMILRPVFERVSDPLDRVFAVLAGYRQMLVMSDCRVGCPIGNLALEMSEKSEVVREKIALNFANWRRAIRECLFDARDRLPPDLDRHKLAAFILTIMEGGVMQARVHRSLEPFDASVAMLKDYMDRLVEEGTHTPIRKANS